MMPSLASECLKPRDVVIREIFGPPLIVVLGEHLHAVALAGLGRFDRFVVAAGNGHVSADGHFGKLLKFNQWQKK